MPAEDRAAGRHLPSSLKTLKIYPSSDALADVYDDDHEEIQACEANPDPGSTLGLCADHDARIMAAVSSEILRRSTSIS